MTRCNYSLLSCRHRAIREYLKARSMTKSLEAFEEESGIGATIQSQGEEPKYTGLLEKKWTSVVRLQKKVRLSFTYPYFYKLT